MLIKDISILGSLQYCKVPLLQGDAMDHYEVVEVVVGHCCTYRYPTGL